MINFHLFGSTEPNKCRRVGMADEADSKSVVGNHVRVQVPPPALKLLDLFSRSFLFFRNIKVMCIFGRNAGAHSLFLDSKLERCITK